MGNAIKSCPPNVLVPLKSVNLKNINSTCVKCVVSEFDAGKCDKTCEDDTGNSVLTQNRTIITQPKGGWSCPPLTQTTKPCPGLMKCVPAVVTTMYKYTSNDFPIDFTITPNSIMYILFQNYILQINLIYPSVMNKINIPSKYLQPSKIASSSDNDIIYIFDLSTKQLLRYTIFSGVFTEIYTNTFYVHDIAVTKDTSNNDVIYFCELNDNNDSFISKIYMDGGVYKKDIIHTSTSICMGITLNQDVIYVTYPKKNHIKKIYNNNTYEIIDNTLFSYPIGIAFYNNNLYVSSTDNHCILKNNLNTNTVSIIAGSTSQKSGNVDGKGVDNSLFFSPTKMIFFNKVLYVLDYANYSIRKVVDFIQPDCASVPGYTSVAKNTNICQCATGYTGSFNYTDNIISGCNKIYPAQTGYVGTPGNYYCDTSKGYGGTVVYDPNSLSGCKPIPCTSTGYTGTAGSCVCISGYNGTVTYTNGVLGGCNTNTLIIGTGNCNTTQSGNTTLSGCIRIYSTQINFESGLDVSSSIMKSFTINNDAKNINNFIIYIKPQLSSNIQINKVSFGNNNKVYYSSLTNNEIIDGIEIPKQTFNLTSPISIPSNVTVNIYFYIWSNLTSSQSYRVSIII